ncbi:MAG: fumarylacetoacetate hydrolase family protein [Oscillospiraceae bacterium]|nr:fumarylacetoacetate hydrolase family protein [Oscillospiraceae bacterium]
MKLCNIKIDGAVHLGLVTDRGVVDATATGFPLTMDQVIAGGDRTALAALTADGSLPVVDGPVYADVVGRPGKLLCVGLNYRAHAQNAGFALPEYPVLFSKFNDALAPSGAAVCLPDWEESYDYEAELVVVMGKTAWNVSETEAMDYVFGYTCGNDFSCRAPQMRSGQWLIGKTMPGFGPCGPCIVTADAFDPNADNAVRSYVNGEPRQNGLTSDMIFSVSQVVAYASRYVKLEPGDLIFTGTPSGVALEGGQSKYSWLKPGDRVDVEIEGIGTLTNTLC